MTKRPSPLSITVAAGHIFIIGGIIWFIVLATRSNNYREIVRLSFALTIFVGFLAAYLSRQTELFLMITSNKLYCYLISILFFLSVAGFILLTIK